MKTLGLILARAGSQGVPAKNTTPIAGAPCVRWTIEAALEALHRKAIDTLALSTDCDAVSAEARNRGLALIQRPASLATHDARIDDTARHALSTIEQRLDQSFDALVILYANVPVRPHGLIERAVATLATTQCDSVQSYTPVGKNHPCWTAVVDDATGIVRAFSGDQLNHGIHRRQDLPPAHIPDGGVLVVSRNALLANIPDVQPGPHAFLGNDRRGILTSPGEVVDIDNPIDAIVADAIIRQRLAAEQELHESLAHSDNRKVA